MEIIQIRKGSRFGAWTVQSSEPERVGEGRQVKLLYPCLCDCGVSKSVYASNLRRGKSLSCGCARDLETSRRSATHGKSRSPVYAVWRTMLQRCNDPGFAQYADYGGRGIRVSDDWTIFENFYEDMGDQPFKGASLERKENDLGYCKENVVWATRTQQARNKRNNHLFSFQGFDLTIAEWAEKTGIKRATLVSRLYLYGWSAEKAFTTPVKAIA